MSLRKAIDQHCRDCIVDEGHGGGTWRQQVQACTSPNCALFDVRPISKPKVAGTGEVPEGLRKWREKQAGEAQ